MRQDVAISIFLLCSSCITTGASWSKVSGYKFIGGTSLGSESTYFGSLATAKPKCEKRCDEVAGCTAFRLYGFAGTVYCTLFKDISSYSCPTNSLDWGCIFAEGESWVKSK